MIDMIRHLDNHLLPTLAPAIALVIALGCSSPQSGIDLSEDQGPLEGKQQNSIEPPTAAELASASYHGIAEQRVTLVDGEWEGEPFVEGGVSRPAVGLVDDFALTGDLNGDGKMEAVALLWSSSGGSGTFDYLAAMGRDGDQIVQLGLAELGDRIKIRSYEIDGERIVLEVVQAGPDDAACCPGQKLRRTWSMTKDGLSEGASEDLGRLSIADLSSLEWVLRRFTWEEAAPEQPEITLVFNDQGASGFGGCNRFNVTISDGEMPGDLQVGPVASTSMTCSEVVDALEARFLLALQAATQYSFLVSNLAINWVHEDRFNTMILEPRPLSETPK